MMKKAEVRLNKDEDVLADVNGERRGLSRKAKAVLATGLVAVGSVIGALKAPERPDDSDQLARTAGQTTGQNFTSSEAGPLKRDEILNGVAMTARDPELRDSQNVRPSHPADKEQAAYADSEAFKRNNGAASVATERAANQGN